MDYSASREQAEQHRNDNEEKSEDDDEDDDDEEEDGNEGYETDNADTGKDDNIETEIVTDIFDVFQY